MDQYRKKSQLYGGENNHNVVLIPLGDDFRWQDMKEANDQYLNYEMLINYMNSRKDWNVDIRFGTLSDYFELLKKQSEKKNKRFETLSGDFFTYADRQDHYWSGYFTSRVFYKRLDRLVEYYLRNAEIVFSLSNLAQMDRENKFTVANKLYKQLLVARRNLGLFQHHDGITGTSKTYVVNDYANKYCFSSSIHDSGIFYFNNLFIIDCILLWKTRKQSLSTASAIYSLTAIQIGSTSTTFVSIPNHPLLDISQ